MKIYISGPITGKAESNLPAFRVVAESLAESGHHEVVVPHDIPAHQHEGECPQGYAQGEEHTSACYLRGDLVEMLTCDAVYMLWGWEKSIGARLEHSVAAHCGLKMLYQWEPA